MLLIISPAKTFNTATPARTAPASVPEFLPASLELIRILKRCSTADIGRLMHISPRLARLNRERFQNWPAADDSENSVAALLAFGGDLYRGMGSAELSPRDLAYAHRHMRILSGLYGLLRPLDAIRPYRLEMGTRLTTPQGTNLYAFWADRLTQALNRTLADDSQPVVVNLASQEYFKALQPRQLRARVISPVFKDYKSGNYKVIGFYAKRARGLMAGHVIRQRITRVEQLREFQSEGYRFEPRLSTENEPVFTRKQQPR